MARTPLRRAHMRANVLPKPAKGTATRLRRAAKRRCKRCGAEFDRGKPSHTAKGVFCGRRCQYAYRVESNEGRQRPCPVCGKPVGAARRFTATNITCSPECGYEYRKRRMRMPRPCDHCGREYFPLRKIRLKYCSKACHVAAMAPRVAFLVLACANCGNSFRRTRAAVRRLKGKHVFCGRACAKTFLVGQNNPLYRGARNGDRGGGWSRRSEAIRQRDGYRCRRCGKAQEENGQKLSVDHVRPWRAYKHDEKADANDPDNLVALCRSCHTYKTTVVESAWLRGDRVTFNTWLKAIEPGDADGTLVLSGIWRPKVRAS